MKLFGLIGKPLTHSFSKTYFTQKFTAAEVNDCRYENFELKDIADLPGLISTHQNLKGLNVTIPFKEQVLPFLSGHDVVVKEVGACNCIKVVDGKLFGFNTDVIGFTLSLEPCLKSHHRKALVLGTGGAAKAVAYSLRKLGIEYKLVSRKQADSALAYDNLTAAILEEYPVIINTSPLGMYPNIEEEPPLPYQYLSSQHLLYDLIYNPAETRFMQHGIRKGATVINGYQMLVIQAEESWKIWNG